MRLLTIGLLVMGVFGTASVFGSTSRQARELIFIDGHNETIATATAKQMSGTEIALSVGDLIFSIVKAFNEPEFDYWGNVQQEVEALVFSYINEHNMNQVEAFQSDLEKLLLRYLEAPIQSDNYPDKNEQASALSMAIIAHRYLVMSGDLRFSLILHFEDIASMHLVVLKDAAETYSIPDKPSLWWVDLDRELNTYITYSAIVRQEFRDFRLGMISCTEEINVCELKGERKTCYDIYTINDGVTGEVSTCRQLTGYSNCLSHCADYSTHRTIELDMFEASKVTPVVQVWEELEVYASEMAEIASPFRNPARQE